MNLPYINQKTEQAVTIQINCQDTNLTWYPTSDSTTNFR